MVGRIGPYEVLSELGRGGMGVVLKARDASGRVVAIKVLLRPDAQDALARFERERRLLASFGLDQGFVPLLESGSAGTSHYLVLPFLEGGTLRDRLKRFGRLDPEEVLALGRALARALALAHASGIVHRDLKPENVLFDREGEDGRPFVSDLGLGKHFRRDDSTGSVSITQAGDLAGTIGYMPLEQMRDARSVGPTADVFALGAMLYECLTGKPAFAGVSAFDVLERVREGTFVPIAKARPETPPSLAAAIERALSVAPEARFADARAFGRALEPRAAAGTTLLFTAAALALVAGSVVAIAVAVKDARDARDDSARAAGEATRALEIEARRDAEKAEGARVEAARREAERLVASSDALLDKGEVDRAIEGFTRALALDPANARASWRRGVARGRRGDLAAAIADLGSAVAAEPRNAAAWRDRAWLLHVRGSFKQARADASRAIELDPRSAEAWALRGLGRLEEGDARGALEDCGRAVELDAKNVHALHGRGHASERLGDLRSARADFERVVKLEPREASHWRNLGVLRRKNGDLPGAAEAFGRAIERDPSKADHWWGRGWARVDSGDVDGAIADCSKALELDPAFAAAWRVRGIAFAQKGELDPALRDLDRAIALDDRSAVSWSTRGKVRYQREDAAGARTDLVRATELDAGLADAWDALAVVLMKSGDHDAALRAANRAVELAPGDADYLRNRGAVKDEAGDREGAIADWRRYLEKAPRDRLAPAVRKRLAALEGSR